MENNNIIKDTIILANIIELMRLATSKTAAMCFDVVDEGEDNVDTGADFHAATIASLMGLDIIDNTDATTEGAEENDQ